MGYCHIHQYASMTQCSESLSNNNLHMWQTCTLWFSVTWTYKEYRQCIYFFLPKIESQKCLPSIVLGVKTTIFILRLLVLVFFFWGFYFLKLYVVNITWWVENSLSIFKAPLIQNSGMACLVLRRVEHSVMREPILLNQILSDHILSISVDISPPPFFVNLRLEIYKITISQNRV